MVQSFIFSQTTIGLIVNKLAIPRDFSLKPLVGISDKRMLYPSIFTNNPGKGVQSRTGNRLGNRLTQRQTTDALRFRFGIRLTAGTHAAGCTAQVTPDWFIITQHRVV